jgi:hypothetical protein
MVAQDRAIWRGYCSVAGDRGVSSGTGGKSNSLQSLALVESQAVKMNFPCDFQPECGPANPWPFTKLL